MLPGLCRYYPSEDSAVPVVRSAEHCRRLKVWESYLLSSSNKGESTTKVQSTHNTYLNTLAPPISPSSPTYHPFVKFTGWGRNFLGFLSRVYVVGVPNTRTI